MQNSRYEQKERKPYDILGSVFNSVMVRELEIVTDYWTQKKYRIFARSNKNTNEQNSKSQFYYYADEGISEGSLIEINRKTYLALNQATVENTLYKKSDLFECNIVIDTFSNGHELEIPGFSYYLTSVFGNDYPQVSVVSGNMQVITIDNDKSRSIKVNSRFNALGAEWRIEDRVSRNGLIHFYISKQAETPPPDRELEILSRPEYEIGKSEYINVWAKRKESSSNSWSTVHNATILWESSNSSVVSFDDEGFAYFKNVGTATITAIWKEHNIIDSADIAVVAEALPVFEISYAGNPEVRSGGSAKAFHASFGELEDSCIIINPVWELELTAAQQGRVTYTYSNDYRTINITAVSGAPTNTTFTLWLTTNSYYTEVRAKVDVHIISLF